MKGKCYFCDSTDTKFCDICGEYLCDNHRKNFPKRARAFFIEKILKRKRTQSKV